MAQQFLGELFAGHAIRHDEVREQEADFGLMFPPDFEGGMAGGGLKDVIAEARQNIAHEGAEGLFVFHEQNGPRPLFRTAAGGIGPHPMLGMLNCAWNRSGQMRHERTMLLDE